MMRKCYDTSTCFSEFYAYNSSIERICSFSVLTMHMPKGVNSQINVHLPAMMKSLLYYRPLIQSNRLC